MFVPLDFAKFTLLALLNGHCATLGLGGLARFCSLRARPQCQLISLGHPVFLDVWLVLCVSPFLQQEI